MGPRFRSRGRCRSTDPMRAAQDIASRLGSGTQAPVEPRPTAWVTPASSASRPALDRTAAPSGNRIRAGRGPAPPQAPPRPGCTASTRRHERQRMTTEPADRPLVTVLGATGFPGPAVFAAPAGHELCPRAVARRPAAVPDGACAEVEVVTAGLTGREALAATVKDAGGVIYVLLCEGGPRPSGSASGSASGRCVTSVLRTVARHAAAVAAWSAHGAADVSGVLGDRGRAANAGEAAGGGGGVRVPAGAGGELGAQDGAGPGPQFGRRHLRSGAFACPGGRPRRGALTGRSCRAHPHEWPGRRGMAGGQSFRAISGRKPDSRTRRPWVSRSCE